MPSLKREDRFTRLLWLDIDYDAKSNGEQLRDV